MGRGSRENDINDRFTSSLIEEEFRRLTRELRGQRPTRDGDDEMSSSLKNTRKYANTGDIRQKLNNTIVVYDGTPVYCSNNGESSKIELFGLLLDGQNRSTYRKTIEYDDPKLSAQSPPIGYINVTADNAIYASRVPSRRFSIGLTRECLEFRSITGTAVNSPIRNWPYNSALDQTIRGVYKRPHIILDELYKPNSEKAWAQAFTRTLAFGFSKQYGLRLFHKNTAIAYYNPKDQKFHPIKNGMLLVDNILVKQGIKSYAPQR